MRYTTLVGNPLDTTFPLNLFNTTQEHAEDNLVMLDHEWLLKGNSIPARVRSSMESQCVIYSGTESVNWDHSPVPDQIREITDSAWYAVTSAPQGEWLEQRHPGTRWFVYSHWEHSTAQHTHHWHERRREDPHYPDMVRTYLWMARRATPDRLAIHYRLLRSGLAQDTWIAQGTHNYWSDAVSHDYEDYWVPELYDHPTSRKNYRTYMGVPQPQQYLREIAESHIPAELGGTEDLSSAALYGEHEAQPIWRAYHHTDIHLIAESFADKSTKWMMPTEKTFKSLASARRPWILAQPGFYTELARSGYDVQIPAWDFEQDPVQRLNEWWHNIENGLIPDVNGEHNYHHLQRRSQRPDLPEPLESYRAVKR